MGRGFKLLRVCLRWRVAYLRDLNPIATLRVIDRGAQMRGARNQHPTLLLRESVAVLRHAVIPLRPGRVGLGPMIGFRVVAGTGIVGDCCRDLVKLLHRLRRSSRAAAAALIDVTDGSLLRVGEARESKQRSQNQSAHECLLTQLQARYARTFEIDRAR